MARPDTEQLDYLIDLFDDPDTVVADAVDARLRDIGPTVVRTLHNRASREGDAARKSLIDERARRINIEFKLADLQEYTKRATGPLSLFEGGWIVSSLLDHTLQRDRFESMFFRCSQEYLAESSDQRTGVENIRIFNHIFFHRLKFTLYDVVLQDPRYSLLSDALRTHKGNPFVLAFIYLMICQVAGLPVELVCFTGGFIPVYVENGKVLFYINVYRGGDIFPADRLEQFLRTAGVAVTPQQLRRRDESSMLTLYLESLLYIHAAHHDDALCQIIERALSCLGPERFLTVDETE